MIGDMEHCVDCGRPLGMGVSWKLCMERREFYDGDYDPI